MCQTLFEFLVSIDDEFCIMSREGRFLNSWADGNPLKEQGNEAVDRDEYFAGYDYR